MLKLKKRENETLIIPLSNQKGFSHANPRSRRYLNFKIGLHADFWHFSHTKAVIFIVFTCFYLIFCLSEFYWNFWYEVFLNPKKIHFWPKKSKNHQKIFLTSLLYGICSLWIVESEFLCDYKKHLLKIKTHSWCTLWKLFQDGSNLKHLTSKLKFIKFTFTCQLHEMDF